MTGSGNDRETSIALLSARLNGISQGANNALMYLALYAGDPEDSLDNVRFYAGQLKERVDALCRFLEVEG